MSFYFYIILIFGPNTLLGDSKIEGNFKFCQGTDQLID